MRWIYLTVLISSALQGGVLDHLKKVEDKSRPHGMRNIDFIYMINLDRRPDRYQKSIEQLKPYRIIPCRFSAVDAKNLTLDVINDVGVKFDPSMKGGKPGTYFKLDKNGHCIAVDENVHQAGRTYFHLGSTRATIACSLSHLSILKDAFESGYETIWVMEDDIDVIQDPHLLSDLIEELDDLVGKQGWDILFTDYDHRNTAGYYVPCREVAWRLNYTPDNPDKFFVNQKISPHFRKIGARYGAHSMIIRRSGMKKLLDFFRRYQIYQPYDMDYLFPPDIQFYTVTSDVVGNLIDGISDIQQENDHAQGNVLVPRFESNLDKTEIINAANRCYGWCSREKTSILIDLVLQAKPETIVEIGVYGGRSLIVMALTQQMLKIGKTYGIDPWDSQASVQGLKDQAHLECWSSINHEAVMHDCMDKIRALGLEPQVKILRATSAEAPLIKDIGILHVDGNHSEDGYLLDVVKWVPQVKKGGLVILNDLHWQENGINTTERAIQWLDDHCQRIEDVTQSTQWGIWVKS